MGLQVNDNIRHLVFQETFSETYDEVREWFRNTYRSLGKTLWFAHYEVFFAINRETFFLKPITERALHSADWSFE